MCASISATPLLAKSQPQKDGIAEPQRGFLAWLEKLGRQTASSVRAFAELLGIPGSLLCPICASRRGRI